MYFNHDFKVFVASIIAIFFLVSCIQSVFVETEEIITESIRYVSQNAGVIRTDEAKILDESSELKKHSKIAELQYETAFEQVVEASAEEPLKFYVDENNIAYQVIETIDVIATAYCHCQMCCGKTPDHEAYGITKSGVDLLAPGADIRVVAADPSVLSLGTKIFIEVPVEERDTMYVTADYGFASVEDTGGAIDGNRIDVYFPTHQKACEWGVRNVQVHIVIPVY